MAAIDFVFTKGESDLKFQKSRLLALTVALAGVLTFPAGCSNAHASQGKGTYKVGMLPDSGGVNDQSFNQSAWSGLQDLHIRDASFSVGYVQAKSDKEIPQTFDQAVQAQNNLVWGIGFSFSDAILAAAKKYPKTEFVMIDSSVDHAPSNLTCIAFRAQESSFLVGYIAALKTSTDKVGFIGGVKSATIDQFEYGFRAGVAYGAKELGKKVSVDVQYANTFSDPGLGKTLAQKLYASGDDILFPAAGGVGIGVIAQAKADNKYVDGVDLDQSYLAPNNVLISALKNVGATMQSVSQSIRNGKETGGKTEVWGLKEGGVGIPYTDQSEAMCGADVLGKAKQVQNEIIAGKIVPPATAADFQKYISNL